MRERICFDYPAALLSYGFQSCFQGDARNAESAVPLIDDKAGYSPKSPCAAFGSKSPIVATPVDTRKLLFGAVLAPSHRFSFRVHQNPMGTSARDEFFLFPPVPHSLLNPSTEPLVPDHARPVKMHTPTKVPAASSGKKTLKIRPGPRRQLPGCIFQDLRRHRNAPAPSRSYPRFTTPAGSAIFYRFGRASRRDRGLRAVRWRRRRRSQA